MLLMAEIDKDYMKISFNYEKTRIDLKKEIETGGDSDSEETKKRRKKR